MKAHKIYPLPTQNGNQREALLEFEWHELCGLHKLLGEVINDAHESHKVILNFESSTCTNIPMISCIYEKVTEQ